MAQKNTRIIYRDDAETFASLNAEDCQRLLLAYLNYQVGEDINNYFEQGDPLKCLFLQMKKKIDFNERKYAETCKKRADAANSRWHKENVDTETGEIITSTETQNKAPEEPIEERDEEVIICKPSVAEIAQKVAKNGNNNENNKNTEININNNMHFDDGKYWFSNDELRQIATEIWKKYKFNADSNLDDIKRTILPQYTQQWANIHKTQLADLIGLGIHNLKQKKNSEAI